MKVRRTSTPRGPGAVARKGEQAAADAAEEGSAITPVASPLVRWLGLLHVAYLLALPFAGLPEVYRDGPFGKAIMWGWVPGLVYVLLTVAGYRLHGSPWRALLFTIAVPLQVALLAWVVDADLAEFFHEAAVIEVGTLVFGVTLGMIIARPTGAFGAVVMVGVSLLWFPYASSLIDALPTWSRVAKTLCASSFATGLFETTRMVVDKARSYNASGETQLVDVDQGEDGANAKMVRLLEVAPRRFELVVMTLVALGCVAMAIASMLREE